jgi:preprotein translocase subunit SecF
LKIGNGCGNKMSLNFLKYKKIYFIFSTILILASFSFLIVFGLKPGIDFTGGSILEIEYTEERPSNQEIKETLSDFDLGEVLVQPTEERGIILKMKDISEDTHQEILEKLKENKELEERRFESIGPVIGQELKEKTKIVIILSLLAIVLYIAWAFRKISRPIPSWQYGIASLLALFHDVLIPISIFSVLGKFYGVQITIPVITALLTVLGYSINNTVVVFDRIRENLLKQAGTYQEIVNNSLNQTLTRSINTSLTTLFVLVAIFFLGGVTLKYFALALILGIVAGTYSSIFLASPVLVAWLIWRKRV